jgi:hypothetical protein
LSGEVKGARAQIARQAADVSTTARSSQIRWKDGALEALTVLDGLVEFIEQVSADSVR